MIYGDFIAAVASLVARIPHFAGLNVHGRRSGDPQFPSERRLLHGRSLRLSGSPRRATRGRVRPGQA